MWPHPPLVVGKWQYRAVSQASLRASTLSSVCLCPCFVMDDQTARTILTRSTVVGAHGHWVIFSFFSLLFIPLTQISSLFIGSSVCNNWHWPDKHVNINHVCHLYLNVCVFFHLILIYRYSSNQRPTRAAQPDQLCRETRFPWRHYYRCPRPPHHRVTRWHSRCGYIRGHGSTWTSEHHTSKYNWI